MEYSINQLAKLSGVTTRTLRHYNDIGLLLPVRKSSSGYRIYSSKEVDKLQQIMFYKNLGVELTRIKEIIDNPNFNAISSLENHLINLEKEKLRIDRLINTLTLTIKDIKGEYTMKDTEKFDAFKDNLIKENTEKYGDELNEKYSKTEIDASNKKLKNMTQEQWDAAQELSKKINMLLIEAVNKNDPESDVAKELCDAHKEWICYFWQSYSKEAHLGLCIMYTQDERFKKYYDDIIDGGAEFLLSAMQQYLKC